MEPADGDRRWGVPQPSGPRTPSSSHSTTDRTVLLPASANPLCLEGKRLCRAPGWHQHCKTSRGTQSSRALAAKRCPAELPPQPASPRVPPSSCRHRHWPVVAPQQHTEPSRDRGVKCKAARQSYKYICSALAGATGRCKEAAKGQALSRGSGEVLSCPQPRERCRRLADARFLLHCAHMGRSHMARTPVPWGFAVCPMLSSWGGQRVWPTELS